MDHTQIAKIELPDAGEAWQAADTVAKVTDVTRKIAASDAVKVSLGCELFERRPAWNVYHDGRNGIGDTPLEALDQLFPNRRQAAEARLEEVRRVMDKLSKRIPELVDEEARLVKELEGER